jgi:hypothetical protein
MSQHVRMNWKRKLSGYASSLDHPQEPSWRYWRSSFRYEYIRRSLLEWA